MMSRRPWHRLAAAGASAVLMTTALVACAGADQNASLKGGSSVLTIQGDAGDPTLTRNFNPFSATQLHGDYLIFEPLEIPSEVDGTYTPFLATGFHFASATSLHYTLRSGVKWTDGQPFTSADVVFTFDLLKKNKALDTTGVWSQLASVQANGKLGVTMTFTKPSVPFASIVSQVPIVPEHLWKSVTDPVKYTDPKPVGTGPFMLGAFAPTLVTLAKNPNYWNAAKIAPSEVKMPAQSSSQSTNQLDVTSGKYDWSYNFLPDVQQTYVDRDKAHNVYWFPPGGTIGLYLNLTKPTYQNVHFRLGLSYAMKRSSIAQKAVNGYTTAASSSGLILPNLQQYLDPSLPNRGNISQNMAKAMSEFHQAGYTSSGGKLTKNGQQAKMTIVAPNNFSDWIAAATEVKSQLGAVGISVSLDEPQYAQYQTSIASGNFDAAIGGFGGTGNVYNDFNNALNSAFAAPVGTQTINNFERYKNKSLDAALSTLAGAVGQSAQKQASFKLEQIMYTQQPIVLMYYGGSWGLFSTKNFVGWPSATDPYDLPTSYNYAMLLILTHLRRV
jgi:peptide/nickel transport system substrate-binding protein